MNELNKLNKPNDKLDTLRFKVYDMLEVFESIRLEINCWDKNIRFPVGKVYKLSSYEDIEILIFDLKLNDYDDIKIEEVFEEATIKIYCD